MNKLTRYRRLLYIVWIIASYHLYPLLSRWQSTKKVAHFFTLLFLLNPLAWFRSARYTRYQRLRLALIKLGPIFVKFGQILSTRPDLLPYDLVLELAKLQDQVPAFNTKQVNAALNQAYKASLDNLFLHIDRIPLASASIAQVHAATLSDGSDVVIKIVRPTILNTIQKDVAVLYLLAQIANRLLPQAPLLRLNEVVKEFERTILQELDMQREAEHATTLRNNFMNSPILYVPKIYWPYVRPNILVMERIYGIRISDIATLKARGANLKVLAENGVKIFYTQVFRDKFFHADMHPGNIFVNLNDPNNPIYCGVDFGIMGTLTEEDRYYLGENFMAFFNRDYHRVAMLHIESGWVPKNTPVIAFEAAIRKIADPMFKKPLNEISFGQVLVNLLRVAQEFNMVIQPQLLLLQKTLLNVEGLGRQLYPELDLWQTAKPLLEDIMGKKFVFASVVTQVKKLINKASLDLEKLPQTIHSFLSIFR